MLTTTELKPCPFCGGEAVVEKSFYSWGVSCVNCFVQFPWMDKRAQAVEAWNRRVECVEEKIDLGNDNTKTDIRYTRA